MNGEVNGSMEEAPSTSRSDAPDIAPDFRQVISADYRNDNEDSNNTENSNHLGSEHNNGPEAHIQDEYLANENSNESAQQHYSSDTEPVHNTNLPDLVQSARPDCGYNTLDNSNDSCPDSNHSSQAREMLEQHVMHINQEKNQDTEKIITNDQNTNSQNAYDHDSYEGGKSSNEQSPSQSPETESRVMESVSNGSDSEPNSKGITAQKIETQNKDILENDEVSKEDLSSPDIHEIESDNDDCVVTNKCSKANTNENQESDNDCMATIDNDLKGYLNDNQESDNDCVVTNDEDSKGNSNEKQDSDNDDCVVANDEDTKTNTNENLESDNDDCVVTNDEATQESDNDDCMVTNDEPAKSDNKKQVPLRRSSRAIKRKRYDGLDDCDDDSDVEEVAMTDQTKRKCKPIVINDTKALVEMAARQIKSGHSYNQKKEPTVVIIDTNSKNQLEKPSNKAFGLSISSNSSTHNLYQSIVARGTTVTPLSSKTNSTTNNSHAQQPSILPSLTDDMFVVEAPSFIVPYVYEKPSLKPFREFVDILGKELDEQKAKADKELLEKQKAEKEKQEKEKQEMRQRGEEVEDSEEEKANKEAKPESQELEEKKQKKLEKRERRRRKNEDDDMSWDGESSSDSDDDIISDEEGKTVVIKEKDDSIEEINDVSDLTAEKFISNKKDNYFDCSLGKFFIDIGLNLVQEYVQSDLLKQQNRKLYREKKTGHSTKSTEVSIASLMKNLEFSKENNAPYKFKHKKCEFCSFKTESMLVLAHHLETPHMKNNNYKCNLCPFEIRSPHDILYHMEAEHNTRGKLERAPSYHQCANCPFEDNGKGKLARHLIPCAKKFKPELNLAPPVEWEPPAKIPKIARARNNMMGSYQTPLSRGQIGNNMSRPTMNLNMMAGMNSSYRPRGKGPTQVAPRQIAPIPRGGVLIRPATPVVIPSNYNAKPKSMHQPSISITPLPRQPQPVPQPQPQPSQMQNKGTFVICEICDGYIKDLEQLRNHMQWIHKVKIHPKMIYNRPPLNCQKCQFRFFTDQGLERHLLGSHGLVTSSMQEAANKGKDAGRCPVCGRVYQWKLLNHVARDHNLTLKPAHLSYKCTVCTATFGMYKQFENHVYSAHSVVAKRVMDKNKTSTPLQRANDSLLKPLKINDEITIIPQPAKGSKDK